MLDLRIIEDGLKGEEIVGLLRFHRDELFRLFPPEQVFSFSIDQIRESGNRIFSAWIGDKLAGGGGLMELGAGHGEIKSMRVASEFLGKGIGKAILQHIIGEAKELGYTRISLETGTIAELLPARRLYETHGFTICRPFADYRVDTLSQCMSREL